MNVLSTGLFEVKILEDYLIWFFFVTKYQPLRTLVFLLITDIDGLLFYNQIQFTFRVLQESSAFRLLGISENNAHCELIVLHFSKL